MVFNGFIVMVVGMMLIFYVLCEGNVGMVVLFFFIIFIMLLLLFWIYIK